MGRLRRWPLSWVGLAAGRPIGPASVRAGPTAILIGPAGLIPSLGATLFAGSCVSVSRRQHVRPDRPELTQPVLGVRLVAICVGPPVVGLPAKSHRCRHSPTSTHRQPGSSARPFAAAWRAAVGITSEPARPVRIVVAHEPTGQRSHARLAAATRLRLPNRQARGGVSALISAAAQASTVNRSSAVPARTPFGLGAGMAGAVS